MSRARTAAMTCSRAVGGSAPGWAKTKRPCLNAIRVVIEVMPAAAASARSASVSTLPKTTSGCPSEACSKTGAKWRHGPHQAAQKSTNTTSLSVTVRSKLPAPNVMVAMCILLHSTGSLASPAPGTRYPLGYIAAATNDSFPRSPRRRPEAQLRRQRERRPRPAGVAAAGSGQLHVAVTHLPQEVLLEAQLHPVGLRSGDEHPVLARRQHLVGQDDHAVVAGVHYANSLDVSEGLGEGGLLSLDLCGDVASSGVGHHLGREAGLGDADGRRGLPGDVDGSCDADGVDVVVLLALVGVPHPDIALVVGKPVSAPEELLAHERRDDHAERERQRLAVGQDERAVVDVVDAHGDARLNALLLQEHAEQLLPVGQTSDAEVAEE